MTVEFKKIRNTASILNPMNAFQEDKQSTEICFDPLTGVKRLFSAGLTEKAKMFYQPADENLIEMITYSGPLGKNSDSFCSSVKIATRPNFNGNYISDIHFAPLFYMEDWFANLPEHLASLLKAYF